jgi:hypothetical protein
MGEAPKGKISETIRQARDRLTGQPQERQHSARVAHAKREGDAGTWDRLPPAWATIDARGIVTGGRDTASRLRDLPGLGERKRIEPGPKNASRSQLARANTSSVA